MSAQRAKLAAFSLVELVVVLTILAMVTIVAQPRLVEYADRDRLRRSAGRVRTDLRAIQAEAVRSRGRTAVAFSDSGDFYVLLYEDVSSATPTWKPLERISSSRSIESVVALGAKPDYGVGIAGITLANQCIIFDAYGVPCTGGQITLFTYANEVTLDFSSDVGRVSYGETSPQTPVTRAARGRVNASYPSNAEVAATIAAAMGGAPVDLANV